MYIFCVLGNKLCKFDSMILCFTPRTLDYRVYKMCISAFQQVFNGKIMAQLVIMAMVVFRRDKMQNLRD